jgi:GR25 family glycosyltransferase involved in LPS biosynthesis
MAINHHIFSAFDSIKIISLAKRRDRRKETTEELAPFGLIPGRGIVRFFNAIQANSINGFPNIGQHGCYLSHLAVLKESVKQNVTRLLVLEDDAMLMSHMDDSHILLNNLDEKDWDILYLGHYIPPKFGDLHWVRTPSHEGVMCTHGYALNRRVIPRLITYLEECMLRPPNDPLGGPMPIDGAFSMFRAANPDVITYRASTALIHQRCSQSDIAGPKPFEAVLPAALVYQIRRVKNWVKRTMERLKNRS